MLWREPIVARMPDFPERAALSPEELRSACDAFAFALEEAKRPPKWVVICDGMMTSAVLVRDGRVERFFGHAIHDAERRLVISVLSLALSKSMSVPLRNRISSCGRYAVREKDNQKFPVEPEPPLEDRSVSRLLVLGTPQEREEFYARMGNKPPPRPRGEQPPE